MLEIKVYVILDQVRIDATIIGDPHSHATKVTWQEPLSERSPLRDLTNAVTNALVALDGVQGEVLSDLGVRTG